MPLSKKACGSFNRAVKDLSEIPEFSAHRFRHTYAVAWLREGGLLEAIQQILGHRDITTTMRYGKVGETHVEDEARRVVGFPPNR